MSHIYTIDNGLIVQTNDRAKCAGYIFNFKGHGAFDPLGKLQVDGRDVTDLEVETHNAILGKADVDYAKQTGQGLFYLSKVEGTWQVSTWAGTFKVRPHHIKESESFGIVRCRRLSVYFTGPDGKNWYGVNKGDNQILQSKRLKRQ